MSALPCIGEPISWLKLERFASGSDDRAISTHVAACPACRHCLDEIRGDLVALPPLAVPEAPARRRTWRAWLVPALALGAAAMIALVIWRDRAPEGVPEDTVYVKGIGEVVLGVVRERGGVIREDVHSFAAGDRWKLVVTCPPQGAASVVVSVTEAGAPTSDHPLPPATLACGNRVVIPGAFTLTGTRPNRVCAKVTSPGGDAGTACVTITAE
ncbi:MAG: hypothetical protein IPQ07_28785 [Myxococcales bacterium]|nr:hypothetical protein [Myxococcales bacterium]